MSLSANLLLQKMDWPLFRRQKELILRNAADGGDDVELFDGLAYLMDSLQDAAVNQGIATVEQVFGEEDTSAHEEAEHLAELERGYAQDRI